jgi:hypothetical protein
VCTKSLLIAGDGIGNNVGAPVSGVLFLLIVEKLEHGHLGDLVLVFVALLDAKHSQIPLAVLVVVDTGRNGRALCHGVLFIVIMAESALDPVAIAGLAHFLEDFVPVDIVDANLRWLEVNASHLVNVDHNLPPWYPRRPGSR